MSDHQFIQSVYQRPQDLVLLITRAAPQLLTRTLARARLTHGQWQFAFNIIGESHRIQIRRDSLPVLEEIVACVTVPEQPVLHQQTFTDLTDHQYQHDNYQFAISFLPDAPWQIPVPGLDMIEYIFPPLHGQTPRTRIQWQTDESTVYWWTLHTYSEHGQMIRVHTRSSFRSDSTLQT